MLSIYGVRACSAAPTRPICYPKLNQAQFGAHIVNISGGQPTFSAEAHPLLVNAVRNCSEKGVLIVAAAGNNGCACLQVPGALPTVLVVGAMNAQGDPLGFSNWGSAYQAKGVLAPGENIMGALPGGGTCRRTGTSFATAIVSGICGLLMSLQIKHHLNPAPMAVMDAILETALGCEHRKVNDCRRLLAGRLNLQGAISFVLKGTTIMPSEPSFEQTPVAEERTTHDITSEVPSEPGMAVQAAALATPSARITGITALPPTNGSSADQALNQRAGVSPSACSCQNPPAQTGASKERPVQLVYALGKLGFDFGTEANRDYFVASMRGTGPDTSDRSPYNAADLLAYLQGDRQHLEHPEAAEAITWTLNLGATTIYAIRPGGAFAETTYKRLRQFLGDQLPVGLGGQGVERVAIPGTIAGTTRLLNGQVVPVIRPDLRGMFDWTIQAMVTEVMRVLEVRGGIEPQREIANFLGRIYFEFKNLGLTSRDRALNYAGTVLMLFGDAIQKELSQDYHLDSLQVDPSAVCRPNSDCWDIRLTFYNPKKQLEEARRVHLITVDVSSVVPVVLEGEQVFYVR